MSNKANSIIIRGARVHNLKNISLDIPKDKFIVITGLSGSGKSSLAFDTIFAEGQRRFVESMSTFARQFLGVLEKPDVDEIKNLSPAISIDQKTAAVSPRSTVGTMSEIYDFLRLLFSSIGVPTCSNCFNPMIRQNKTEMTKKAAARSSDWYCPNCLTIIEKITISFFSFNSPVGACLTCHGLGQRLEIDPALVIPNLRLTIEEGALRPLQRLNSTGGWIKKNLQDMAQKYRFKLNCPIGRLDRKIQKLILYGDDKFEGVIPYLSQRYEDTGSDYLRREIEKYMVKKTCPHCLGARLRKEALGVKIAGYNIIELSAFPISDLVEVVAALQADNQILSRQERKVSGQIFKEVLKRLRYLVDVGLPYLSIDRSAQTLSGGEAQRIRLASQLGSGLVGVVYILDEPSIGLHPRDHNRLLKSIIYLKDLGNTIIAVEHDKATMEQSDWIIDVGPGAGPNGGEVVAQGTVEEIKKKSRSVTGAYLRGVKTIPVRKNYRLKAGRIKIFNASHFNLKNVDVEIPLQNLVVVTGVSGSGKSTLVSDILANVLLKRFYRAKTSPGAHEKIEGLENLNKVIVVDQSPIGRNVRSNPATYTGVFTSLRRFYADLPEAQKRYYLAERFSFNLRGGRCEVCRGDGMLKFEMHFMPNVFITCEACRGTRYNEDTLAIKYQEKSIADVLNFTVDEAIKFFSEEPDIINRLKVLSQVGLGYLKLGQPATMLSGGEAQRIKLATELSRSSTGKTLYILDEPTTGLHFDDIARLLDVLNKLVDKGNSVVVVEHNLDVIKNADWIIDLGPEGGKEGGYLIAKGTPLDVAKVKKSYTGQFLKKVLG